MGSKWYEGRRLFALLIPLLLSACMYEKQDSNILDTLGSYPKSITFDNEDNAYIATVSGRIARYDGQQLTKFISRGTHGLDFAEEIRFANGILYIHNKRYVDRKTGYVDEVLQFSTEGEYIDNLISQDDVNTTMLDNIDVNSTGQLYSITNKPNIIRVNYDKQGLIGFEPSILITLDIQRILDALKSLVDFDIPDKSITLADILDKTDLATTGDENTEITISQDEILDTLNSIEDPVIGNEIIDISAIIDTLDIEDQSYDLPTITDETYSTSNISNDLDKVKESVNILSLPDFKLTLVNLLGLANITTDMSENIYISCLFGVFRFDRDGHYLDTVAMLNDHDIKIIHSLAVDPYNNLVIASYDPRDTSSMQYLKFDQDGKYNGKFISPHEAGMGVSIHDIAFDSAGNFYVVDIINGVYKFDQTGQFEKIIARPH